MIVDSFFGVHCPQRPAYYKEQPAMRVNSFQLTYYSTKSPIIMADNYLEKQYADYEKRRAEWERQKKLGRLPKKK